MADNIILIGLSEIYTGRIESFSFTSCLTPPLLNHYIIGVSVLHQFDRGLLESKVLHVLCFLNRSHTSSMIPDLLF